MSDKRFHVRVPKSGLFAMTVYGHNRRDALNRFRRQWFPERQRLPKRTEIWES